MTEINMEKIEQYKIYQELILKWKDSSDLTSLKTSEEIQNKHFDDSIQVIPFLNNAKTLIDLGTGAGIPGIPIKIEKPDLEITLVDSRRKKISFLNFAISQLKLKKIKAIQARAEDQTFLDSIINRFDIVISRATWALSSFLKISLPYSAPKGRYIAMKGANWENEIKDAQKIIKENDLLLVHKHAYKLVKGEHRMILIFQKK